jgi:hypothetical protein
MALFEKGQPKTGGRAKGVKNKLGADFLEALAADWREHKDAVIRIVRMESPTEYFKTIANLLPKEFEITENRLLEIPDEELDVFIEFAKRRIAARDADERENSTTH